MALQQLRSLAVLATGFAAGIATGALMFPGAPAAVAQTAAAGGELLAEIEAIHSKLPCRSHAMQDVAYHFANLWFASQKRNWPLADFH